MNPLVPLTVALPLLAAALVAAVGHFVPVRIVNWFAAAVVAAVTVLCVVLIFQAWDRDLVYWFGGWHPRHSVAIGVAFHVDPIGAGTAALASALGVAALVASSEFFKDREVGALFYALMLVFVGGMVGFALTGDLFDMFVFFELMSVAGYALTGYQVKQRSVLQGAINFAVTNTVGAMLILVGIALLYGRTAALNLTQIGDELAGKPVDGLVIASLVLLVVGFLVKAAAAPFHFWLADAYAVAPAAVCVLLAGAMSDLGYHAVGRIYWDVYAGALGGSSATAVRALLIGIGVTTALVGSAMCLLEAELKRIVAFLTIGHGGIFLIGIALLRPEGLAGASAYVETDGLLKGALFLAVGATMSALRGSDELRLHGRGRSRRFVPLAILFAVCGLGLSGLPPFGPFVAKALIDRAAAVHGLGLLAIPITLTTLVTAAAVLRAAARIFLGAGAAVDDLVAEPENELIGEPDESSADPLAPAVLVPAAAMVVVALGVGFIPDLPGRAMLAAARLVDHHARAAQVLRGIVPPPPGAPHDPPLGAPRYLLGAVSALGAVLLAWALLYRDRLPAAIRALARPLRSLVQPLRAVHDGAAGDYVAYLVAGAALFSAVWGIALH